MALAPTNKPDPSDNGRTSVAQYWLQQISDSLRREKDWRKMAQDLVKLYESEKVSETNPYNILFSNTETLSPALYSRPPRPVVKPKFVQKDNALTRMAALMAQRLLQFSLDSGDTGNPNFDECMQDVIPQALVPGRGLMRIRYSATFKEPEAPGEGGEAGEAVEPKKAPEPTEAQLESEITLYEAVSWEDFTHGFSTSWQTVPWVAFKHNMTKEDLKSNFPDFDMKEVSPSSVSNNGDAGQKSLNQIFESAVKSEGEKETNTTAVWEVWDKEARKVYFISPDYPDKTLKTIEEDPLRLQGFFPIPRPLSLYKRINSLIPQPLYKAYEQQAEELTDITIRISKIVRAMRIRGFYDSSIEEIQSLLSQDDNTLLPITNAAMLQTQGRKLDDAIWLFPLEKLVGVLQQLYTQRAQVKSVIFEITGIADIMRGSSQASETLGAQEIKNQWGTLRLKRMQKESERFCRDMLRLMLETMVNLLSPETVRAMTGMPLMTEAEKAEAMQSYKLSALQAMAAQQPAPPQPQELAMPTLENLLQLLQTDLLRNFSITVETNSTVEAEATDDKKDMAELLNAMSQFLNGITPMVEKGAMPFEAAKVILLNLLRRFRMGGEMEEAIMAIQEPSKGGEGEAAQLEQMKQALEKQQGELEQQKAQLEQQKREMQLQQKEAAQQLEMDKNFAMREIEQQKKFAMKEVEQERTFAMREVETARTAFSTPVPAPVATAEEPGTIAQ